MTIEECVKQIQDLYEEKFAEIITENKDLKHENCSLRKDAEAMRKQRNWAYDRIYDYLQMPWWKRMFNTKPLTDPNYKQPK